MGVQGRMNQADGDSGGRVRIDLNQAIDQKRRAREEAKSIGEQVREKLKAHYEGTT